MKINTNIMNFLGQFKPIAMVVVAILLVNCGSGGGGGGGASANQVVNPVIGESEVLELSSFKLVDSNQNEYVGQIRGTNVSTTIPSNVSNNLQVHFRVTTDVESVLLGGNLISNNSSIEIIESQPIAFELLGKNASSKNYTITRLPEAVNPDPAPDPTPPALPVISSFSLLSSNHESYIGVINGNQITVGVPSDVPSAMVANFTTTNGSQVKIGDIVQASGHTKNDFIDGESIVYTVFDENNQTQNYTVTRLSSDNLITEFSLTGFQGESYIGIISGNTINVALPLFATAAPMMARFVTNGALVEVSGVVQNPLGSDIILTKGEPFIYQVVAEDGSRVEYRLNTTRDSIGELTPLTSYIIDGNARMVKTFNDKFVFLNAVTIGGGSISTFRIGKDGSLNLVANLAVESNFTQLLPSPDSHYLYSLRDNKILIYSINGETGELTAASAESVFNLDNGQTIDIGSITPDGKYFYGLTKSTNVIKLMGKLDSSTGKITPLTPAILDIESFNVSSIFVAPNSKYAYIIGVNQEDSCAILMYKIESGRLIPLSPSSVPFTAGANDFLSPIFSKDGKFVYVPGANSIIRYAIDDISGQFSVPTNVDETPMPFFILGMVLTSDNKLYVSGKSLKVLIYDVDQNADVIFNSEFMMEVAENQKLAGALNLFVSNSDKFLHTLLVTTTEDSLRTNQSTISTFGIK
jgi:6-phosphogluconolactonase (cycloisomerase 2 family)